MLPLYIAYYLAIKFSKKWKEKKITLNKNLQNERNYYNKHIPEGNEIIMKQVGGFLIYLIYIKLVKLASETSLNQMAIPV